LEIVWAGLTYLESARPAPTINPTVTEPAFSTRAARHQGPLANSTVEHGYDALEQQRRRRRPEPTINPTVTRPAFESL